MTLASTHEETTTDLNLQREIVSQIRTGPKHCTFVIECLISVQQVEGLVGMKKKRDYKEKSIDLHCQQNLL